MILISWKIHKEKFLESYIHLTRKEERFFWCRIAINRKQHNEDTPNLLLPYLFNNIIKGSSLLKNTIKSIDLCELPIVHVGLNVIYVYIYIYLNVIYIFSTYSILWLSLCARTRTMDRDRFRSRWIDNGPFCLIGGLSRSLFIRIHGQAWILLFRKIAFLHFPAPSDLRFNTKCVI